MSRVSLGRILHYRLTALDADMVNRRRVDARAHMEANKGINTGYQYHVGNHARESDICPLMVVTASDTQQVNGQVTLDGNDTLWVTGKAQGHKNGQWTWPPRVT